MKEGYIKKEDRKKILLITDDIRVHSGVAQIGREIVRNSSHCYNWTCIAGAVEHPEEGKVIDLSQELNNLNGLEDSYCTLYPTKGYGNMDVVRAVMHREKPDAILLITDPRYFSWLFHSEDQIRKEIPITYLNIWDNYPAPMYNKEYYESCDLLMGISKQTVNINKLVVGEDNNKVFRYVPHGLNHEHYFPVDKTDKEYLAFRKQVLAQDDEKTKFVAFFNSRNIRRKQIPDTMLAFRSFLDSLPYEEAKTCKLLLHTEVSSDHGTNLAKVNEYLFGEKYEGCVIFSTSKLDRKGLNFLYNLADVQMLLTSNEGWGLTITEAILAGTPIIANVTGGMQDQMRFVDDKGEWFTPSPDIPSNHRGTYKEHGEWAFPVYPASRSIQGSPPTPYIFDDRCKWEDATERLKEIYNLSPEERDRRGKAGREWAIGDEAGLTADHQGLRILEAFEELFKVWQPKPKMIITNLNEYKGKFLYHKLIY